MNSFIKYLKGIANAFNSLGIGMRLTLTTFFSPRKILTQQYPENKKTGKLYTPERFKAQVTLTHNPNLEHKCTACGLCQLACPNGTINITSISEEIDGKKVKTLDKWEYNLGMCVFCNNCIDVCPQDAIKMANAFENSVYDRNELIYLLNKPGSKLIKKETKQEKTE